MRYLIVAARCKIGIALKLMGCALIHGRGRHLWGPVHEHAGYRSQACRSCGKYRDPPHAA
jgi:hypothetical protein